MKAVIKKLVRNFSREQKKVVDFFKSIENEFVDFKIYTEGSNWTIRQILGHFVESEISLRTLITRVVVEDWPGVSEEFDLDEYNEANVKKFQDKSTDQLILKFDEERSITIETISQWSTDDLQKEGRHPFLGMVTVGEMLKLMYLHHTIHMRDIRNALKET